MAHCSTGLAPAAASGVHCVNLSQYSTNDVSVHSLSVAAVSKDINWDFQLPSSASVGADVPRDDIAAQLMLPVSLRSEPQGMELALGDVGLSSLLRAIQLWTVLIEGWGTLVVSFSLPNGVASQRPSRVVCSLNTPGEGRQPATLPVQAAALVLDYKEV
jgi:hypothetical protein